MSAGRGETGDVGFNEGNDMGIGKNMNERRGEERKASRVSLFLTFLLLFPP